MSSYFRSRRPRKLPNSPTDYFQLRQAKRAQKHSKPHSAASPTKLRSAQTQKPSFEQIIDHEHLLKIFHELKASAGQAPGPDGLTYRDFSNTEAAQITRELSRALKMSSYRPGPALEQRILKSSGNGFRTLRIRNIWDRVVAKAVQRGVSPLWELIFHPRSYGYREGKNIQQMLAAMKTEMIIDNRWIVCQEDIQNAFDHVNIDEVLKYYREQIPCNKLLDLIEVILRGGEENKCIGVDQGCALSPVALNIQLHYNFDVLMKNAFWFRYADNLVYLAQSAQEGKEWSGGIGEKARRAGFRLRTDAASRADLSQGEPCNVLGFQLSRSESGLHVSLSEESWKALSLRLLEAHESPDPAPTAQLAVKGWIQAYGPAFEKAEEEYVVDRVIEMAKEHGFSELGSTQSIRLLCRRSYRAWERYVDAAMHSLQIDQHQSPQRDPSQMTSPKSSFFPADCERCSDRAEAC